MMLHCMENKLVVAHLKNQNLKQQWRRKECQQQICFNNFLPVALIKLKMDTLILYRYDHVILLGYWLLCEAMLILGWSFIN